MIFLSIILMLIAAGLLIAESVVPDFGVLGISGIIMLVLAAVGTVLYVPYGGYLLTGELVFLGAGVVLLVRRARRKQAGSHFILKDTLNEDPPEHEDLGAYVGKYGTAKTSLRPFGVAEISGVNFDVASDGNYIPENSSVLVVRAEKGRLVVKAAEQAGVNIN